MLLIILSHHLMVESEVHFMRSNLVQAVFIGEIYLIDGLFERGEVLQNTLVNQNVSVCQIQNSLFKVRTEQPVDDLKAVYVLPVPVAMTSNSLCCPLAIASTVLFTAFR